MGDAKKRREREQVGHRFHLYKREEFLLLMHVLSKPSNNREERRKRKHMWEELGLVEASRSATAANEKDGLKPNEWGDMDEPIPVRISGGTMDQMIAELAGALQGPAEVILGELEDRLIALRDGGYTPPPEAWPPEDETEAPANGAGSSATPAAEPPSPT